MTGRRISRMLLISLLVSSVGLGGWSTPAPGLAQDTQDAVDVEVSEEPQEDVADVSVFYEPLAPFGTWTSLPEYGQVWLPHGVPPAWRPYTMGRWVYTTHGWTWVSDLPWGWAPFHYGRWAFVASYGWVWIPGTVWGPAWVAWRHAPGWVGWAPLPPQVVFRPGIEISAGNIDVYIAPSAFCFVEERRILVPNVSTYIAPPARNVSLIQITQNVTHDGVIQNRVVNRSIPVERIERVIARPVPRMRIVQAQEPEVMHRAQVKERAREVVLFRPIAPAVTKTPEIRTQIPQSIPPTRLAPGSTFPQQPQDGQRRLEERQHRERAALEERQRNALPPQPQTLSPEALRMQRETERRALEEKTRRDRQQREQQQTQQQLQQRQEQARQQQLQEQMRQQQHQQLQQQRQDQARQQQLQQQQLQQRQDQARQQQLQQQAQERQRAVLQQQYHYQPHPPQGAPTQAIQQQRGATPPAPEADKEQRKRPQQRPQAQQPSQ
jgi:hypothetical protein